MISVAFVYLGFIVNWNWTWGSWWVYFCKGPFRERQGMEWGRTLFSSTLGILPGAWFLHIEHSVPPFLSLHLSLSQFLFLWLSSFLTGLQIMLMQGVNSSLPRVWWFPFLFLLSTIFHTLQKLKSPRLGKKGGQGNRKYFQKWNVRKFLERMEKNHDLKQIEIWMSK